MPHTIQRKLAVLVLAMMVLPITLACYWPFRGDLFRAEPVGFRKPGLYSPDSIEEDEIGRGGPFLEFERFSCYRLGMTREDIRRNLIHTEQLLYSASRPSGGWEPVESKHYLLKSHRGNAAATYDVYQAGDYHHVLFFDDAGVLIGVQRFRSYYYDLTVNRTD